MGTRVSTQASSQTSRRRNGPYGYPPADGESMFSSHYYLGHRKFQRGTPEMFLFGELNDINYIGGKPLNFPYKQPRKSQPLKCIWSNINLLRESLKLVRSSEQSTSDYHLEFRFDSDLECQFTIFHHLPNTTTLGGLTNRQSKPLSSSVYTSPCFRYRAGSQQGFSEEAGYSIDPSQMNPDTISYSIDGDQEKFPVCVLMEGLDSNGTVLQSQLTICTLDKFGESGYSIKGLKQKLLVDGVEYILQEVYGIENKAHEEHTHSDGGSEEGGEEEEEGEEGEEEEDLGAECVICITDARDTLLLPCRHLCLCSSCAANLRYQSSNCPICRSPFQALLQIQALEPLDPNKVIDEDEATGNPTYAVAGFQIVPLLQALNGYKLESSRDPAVQDIEGNSSDEIEAEPVGNATGSPCVVVNIDGDLEQSFSANTNTTICTMESSFSNSHVVGTAANHTQKASSSSSSLGSNDHRQQQPHHTVLPLLEEVRVSLPGTPVDDETETEIETEYTMCDGRGGGVSNSAVGLIVGSACSGSEELGVAATSTLLLGAGATSSQSSISSENSVHSRDVLLPGSSRKEHTTL